MPAPSADRSGPLAGTRILDFSIALTGPYAAALLGDQGADVVKVERPGIGDLGRWVGVSVNGMSALYFTCNRGKRSIALDLHQPEGVEIAQSDSSAYFDWYRIETWKGYDDYPADVVTGNPSDDYERRAPGLGGMWEGVRYQYYEASDGHILFMASEQAFWKNFCEGIGRMDLFEKWPGKTIADHARGNKELQTELRDIFRTRTSQEWIDFADEHNTTIAPANTAQTVRHDAQFQDRFQWQLSDQAGADMLLFPLHVEGEELPVPTKAPELGEHTDSVLRDVLGYDDAKVASLRDAGALG